jgi:hypothetical protein
MVDIIVSVIIDKMGDIIVGIIMGKSGDTLWGPSEIKWVFLSGLP